MAGLVLMLSGAVPSLRAQGGDFDEYKVRFFTFWFNAKPSGSIHGTLDTGNIDLKKDLGLPAYSTFVGKVDWKFTRKNHLYLAASPFNQSREIALHRTITFQGQTFGVGLTARSQFDNIYWTVGYQYDILRRRRGHLGIGLQMSLFDITAKIQAQAQTLNGVALPAVSASKTLLAPIPSAGPEFRIYPLNTPRLFVEGNVYGMYLFGYGNFISSGGTIGVALTRRLSINGGYLLGSRLAVKNTNNRLGVRFTQQGPIAGIEFSF